MKERIDKKKIDGRRTHLNRISDIAHQNPKAFKNITILHLSEKVSKLSPDLVQILQDNGARILYSPQRRETIAAIRDDGAFLQTNDGAHSF